VVRALAMVSARFPAAEVVSEAPEIAAPTLAMRVAARAEEPMPEGKVVMASERTWADEVARAPAAIGIIASIVMPAPVVIKAVFAAGAVTLRAETPVLAWTPVSVGMTVMKRVPAPVVSAAPVVDGATFALKLPAPAVPDTPPIGPGRLAWGLWAAAVTVEPEGKVVIATKRVPAAVLAWTPVSAKLTPLVLTWPRANSPRDA
jgi:hypothetical protein